jgi:hypothetical protein
MLNRTACDYFSEGFLNERGIGGDERALVLHGQDFSADLIGHTGP